MAARTTIASTSVTKTASAAGLIDVASSAGHRRALGLALADISDSFLPAVPTPPADTCKGYGWGGMHDLFLDQLRACAPSSHAKAFSQEVARFAAYRGPFVAGRAQEVRFQVARESTERVRANRSPEKERPTVVCSAVRGRLRSRIDGASAPNFHAEQSWFEPRPGTAPLLDWYRPPPREPTARGAPPVDDRQAPRRASARSGAGYARSRAASGPW